jgi:uncharacterized protein (TIGR04255 family)
MGTPLKTPPLYLTLAQVRFNPVLQLKDFLPSIQENFRQAGFPDFIPQRFVQIQLIVQQQGQPAVPAPIQQEYFQFGNLEKTHSFILDGQSLTLRTTDYGHFEEFSDRFLRGLSIVDEGVKKLAYTERVGLRYLDRVMPRAKETLDQYLVEKAIGLNSLFEGQPVYSFSEAMNEIGGIRLLSRVAIQKGAHFAFPPDIPPGANYIQDRFTSYVGDSATLDNDGFVEVREAFSMDGVARHLETIHEVSGKAFKASVKPFALEVWDS